MFLDSTLQCRVVTDSHTSTNTTLKSVSPFSHVSVHLPCILALSGGLYSRISLPLCRILCLPVSLPACPAPLTLPQPTLPQSSPSVFYPRPQLSSFTFHCVVQSPSSSIKFNFNFPNTSLLWGACCPVVVQFNDINQNSPKQFSLEEHMLLQANWMPVIFHAAWRHKLQ